MTIQEPSVREMAGVFGDANSVSMVLGVQHALEDIVRGERPVGDME